MPTDDDGLVLMSISRLSSEFKVARENVAKRLREAGIESCGDLNGYPVYRLRDVCSLVGVDKRRMKRGPTSNG